jgi:hypothetical protein
MNNFFNGQKKINDDMKIMVPVCPPKMADGARHLTDYRTPTQRNELIKYMSIKPVRGIMRDDQYRIFLQSNGKKILDNEWKYHKKYNSCFPNSCIHNYPLRSTHEQMSKERDAYDELWTKGPSEKLKKMIRCEKFRDSRLN